VPPLLTGISRVYRCDNVSVYVGIDSDDGVVGSA